MKRSLEWSQLLDAISGLKRFISLKLIVKHSKNTPECVVQSKLASPNQRLGEGDLEHGCIWNPENERFVAP